MTTDTTTWLGDNNPFTESFPSASLNEAQVRTLVSFSGERVGSLGPDGAIRRLTESGIVEISVNWVRNDRDIGSAGRLWLTNNGEYIASSIWRGSKSDDSGPVIVYRYLPIPEGLRWRPLGEKAEEIRYDKSRGGEGAVVATRKFIKEHYT